VEPFEAGALEPNKDARMFGMLCHLTAIFLGFVGPLVIWLVKREEFEFVDDQGKEALNFHITVALAFVASAILTIVLIGILLLPVVGIGALVLTIVAAIRANEGRRYRYPVSIRFIK
jgi:uncharacterized Tic20 family protein